MSRADIAIARILAHEGGYVNDPDDNGGPTNKGITLATYRRYINRRGTIENLKAMTTAQATMVYKFQYWDAVQADSLPVGVDYAVADYAVNSGPSRAAKALQGVLGVAQDGKIGPVTLAKAKSLDPGAIIDDLTGQRMAFLRGLSDWRKFGKGWTSRVNGVHEMAMTDIVGAAKPTAIEIIETARARPGFWAWLERILKGA